MITFSKSTFIFIAAVLTVFFSGCDTPASHTPPQSGAWGTAHLIETDSTVDNTGPQLVGNNQGDALVAWEWQSSPYEGWANRWTSATGWLWEQSLVTTTEDVVQQQIAINASGDGIAVWSQFNSNGNHFNLWANRFDHTNGWGTAMSAESATENTEYARVALDDSGTALVIWEQDTSTMDSLWAKHNLPGGGWDTAVQISDSAVILAPRMASDASGNAIVVWYQYNDLASRYEVWMNRFVAGWGWDSPVLLNDADTSGNWAEVTMDDEGNGAVAWELPSSGRIRVGVRRLMPAAGWAPLEFLDTDDATTAKNPHLAMGGAGTIMAVWAQVSGTGDYAIWARRYAPGSGWGNAECIETTVTGPAERPWVACDAMGNAVTVWEQTDGIRVNVWANSYVPSSGWGTAELIETDDGNAMYATPQAVFTKDGDALVVWQQSDGTHLNIWSNRYQCSP